MVITQSPAGLTLASLRQLLQVNVTPTLLRLYHHHEISREKVGPVYLYVSSERSVRQGQIHQHQAEQQKAVDLQGLPDPARIMAVLVELIAEVKLEPEQVRRRLRLKGIPITKAEIQRIWSHYDWAKKKRF